MTGYGHPDSLVETQWLAKHLNDPSVRIIEVGMSPEDCENAHITWPLRSAGHHQRQKSHSLLCCWSALKLYLVRAEVSLGLP